MRNDIIQGQADDAIKRLRQILGSNNQNGEAHNLYCRVSLQLDAWDDAVDHCERAVNISQDNSSYHLWLGRSLWRQSGTRLHVFRLWPRPQIKGRV